jgi:carnitine-CoA ligase
MTVAITAPATIDVNNTVPRVLVRQAERYGAKALIRFPYENEEISYEGLVTAAEAASTRLRRDFGLKPGSSAAIYLGNCADYVRAWFACFFSGAVDVPINHDFKKSYLLFGMTTVDAQIVFTDLAGLQNLLDDEVRSYLPRLKALILAGKVDRTRFDELVAECPDLPPVMTLAELVQPVPGGSRAWEDLDATHPALIRYTSGTSGVAKGVLQSHLHVLGKSMIHNRILEFSDTDVLYSPFPLHHNLASVNGLIGTMQAGGTMVSIPRFSASQYWSDIRKCGATLGHLLQSIAPLVAAQPPSEMDRRHNVRSLWTGGPDPDFEQRFNISWITMYGLSEVGAISFKRGGEGGSTGTGMPLPEFEVQIVDELDRPLAPKARGEIVVRPRQPHRIMLGYHNNLPATMRAFRNLWFHTGDAGCLSGDGELHFFGRLGDTIRRRGVNISSDQIENEIRKHDQVLDCGVIPVAAAAGDQEIHACILWRDEPVDQSGAIGGLAAFLNERLAKGYAPRFFEPILDLPRTNTGKVQKAALRNRTEFGPTWDDAEGKWIVGRSLNKAT